MLPELGTFLLVLALLVALVQAVVPLAGAQRGRSSWMAVARPAAMVQLALIASAFAVLTHAFLVQDFSVRYVAENSNSLLPMMYRYSAVGRARRLAAAVDAGAGVVDGRGSDLVAAATRACDRPRARRHGAGEHWISGVLLFTSNPFARLFPVPLEGGDLNPLLQDPGLIVHPPMLYCGYVGFAVPFAFAIAALLEGRMDARWLRWTRPWTNVAWSMLTVGIALGSWWAYYELGWGGWWFWDPVENASFMPWLVGTALLHSQAVTESAAASQAGPCYWQSPPSRSLLGTFLVRSGVLTSVHSFAADPSRGLFILVFLLLVVGGSLVLYALRAPRLSLVDDPRRAFAGSSRETLLLLNNLLLTCACAMVLLGTLYPLLADALGLGKLSVGPPYFGTLFVVLMAPLVALVPFGPLTRWQREQASRPLAMLAPWAGLALAAGVLAWFAAPQGQLKAAVGVAGAAWVLLGTARFLWTRRAAKGRKFTPEMLGMVLAHLGVAVFLSGALLVEGLSLQREVALAPGQQVQIGRYALHFDGLEELRGPNYVSDRANLQVLKDDAPVGVVHAEKRRYASGGQT